MVTVCTSPLFGFCVLILFLVPINGPWAPWNSWNACSKTCGGGLRTRVRNCIGGSCNRSEFTETEKCNTFVCTCVSWTEWSQCSANCDRVRTRTCHGEECASVCSSNNTQTEVCLLRKGCKHVCDFGFRFWSAWSTWTACQKSTGITTTCGPGGNRVRSRTCEHKKGTNCPLECTGNRTENQICTICCEQEGQWNSWLAPSHCSVTCGEGFQTRTRTCNSQQACLCPGPIDEILSCTEPCTGRWSMWGSWGQCNKPCDFGTRTRSRTCLSRKCSTGNATQEGLCSIRSCTCEETAEWNNWFLYFPCSVTCGEGTESRTRTCKTTECSCRGPANESRACHQPACVRTPGSNIFWGTWGPWESWSECSQICGGGTRSRQRGCATENCGNGFSRDTEFCSMQSCSCDAAWSSWSEWSSCSTNCTQQRVRMCLLGQTGAGCATSCSGHSEETIVCEECQELNCSQENVWSSYSSCSVSCGFGIQNRSRICNSSSCPCTEPLTESQSCQEGVCPAALKSETSILVISTSLIGSIAVLFIGGFLGYVWYKQCHDQPKTGVQSKDEKPGERGFDGNLQNTYSEEPESGLKSFVSEDSIERKTSSSTEISSSEVSKPDSEN